MIGVYLGVAGIVAQLLAKQRKDKMMVLQKNPLYRRLVGIGLLVVLVLVVGACESEPPKVALDDLPSGDAERGAALFTQSINNAPTCASCHQLSEARGVGPGLAGYAAVAGRRVADESAAEYSYFSLVRPTRHLVTGYSNVMPSYEDVLSEQQLADLIAYLLTLE